MGKENPFSSIQGAHLITKPWNKLFDKKKRGSKLEFFPHSEHKDPNGAIVVSPTNVAEMRAKKWENCVVGFFLGRRIPFPMVKQICKSVAFSNGGLGVVGKKPFFLQFKGFLL